MPRLLQAKAAKEAKAVKEAEETAKADSTNRQLRLYQIVIATLVAACFYHFSQEYESLLGLTATDVFPRISRSVHHVPTTNQNQLVHVMFGLSGDHDGFFAEFEVVLKSVLLNAPHHAPMEVHIMTDQAANQKLTQEVWPRLFPNSTPTASPTTQTTNQLWYTNVTLTNYNVESHLEEWRNQLYNKTRGIFGSLDNIHTVGAYFRLFAHKVISSHYYYDHNNTHKVDRVLYMDTDVVVMANLAVVFREAPTTTEWMLQISWLCDGFALIHLPQMDHFWKLIEKIDMSKRDNQFHDQDLVLAIQESIDVDKPVSQRHIQNMSKPWDLYVTRDWPIQKPADLFRYRPQLGAIHYNGGASDKTAYFTKGPFINDEIARPGWGIAANFFRDLPWSWAFYMGQSRGYYDSNTQIRLISA
ncbi:expressed unknown protein [Seminavis robusta]|uniref:Uncharacterized protein n=1 Tax=Seminavis robusta TaxID=568900 RepID=A0A9N8DUY3_9STRA|nr:expressed unknown protein [Seminavis robusta]|eukprot:Sro300_g111780.1 n/a (414) ;mRNA; f:43762-45003